LVQASDGNLYGTTAFGGAADKGTVFRILITPPVIQSPLAAGGNFSFSLQTVAGQSYSIQQSTNLAITNWVPYTNIIGNGFPIQLVVPITTNSSRFLRIREP
jgi:uncharacterized repeat protein (TIGR03803 family)